MSARVGNTNDENVESSGEKYEYDPTFKGYVTDRKCTDCCMFIFFLLFCIGMVVLAIFGGARSTPSFLYTPTDYRGQLCGFNNKDLDIKDKTVEYEDLSSKPFLFWTRPGKKGYARSLCVKKCPDKGLFF